MNQITGTPDSAPSKRAAILVDRLVKSYDARRVVDGVSFTLEYGETVGVIGPNGAGKTTVMECIEGMRQPDAGNVEVVGLDPWTRRRDVHRSLGVQLQQSSLPDRLTVAEAVRVFAALHGVRRPPFELLERWGLVDASSTAFADLSGGQQQRLFVVLALLHDPSIVVLDEVTTGLDPAARRQAWNEVRQLGCRGMTVLLVTHDVVDAQEVCGRIIVLTAGRVVADDTPSALISRLGARCKVTVRRADLGDRDVDGLQAQLAPHRVRVGDAEVSILGDDRLPGDVAQRLSLPHPPAITRPDLEDAYFEIVGAASRGMDER